MQCPTDGKQNFTFVCQIRSLVNTQLRKPPHSIQITKAPARFFDIWLEMLNRVLKSLMAAIRHPCQFGSQIGWRLATNIVTTLGNRRVPHQHPAIQQADAELHIAWADSLAVHNGVHTMTRTIARIPKPSQKLPKLSR